MSAVLFYLMGALVLMGALGVVLSRSPVASVLHMIVSLIGVAGLFFLLEAFLLGILQIFIYAGAVMVLFLFVVMLLDIDKKSTLGGDWPTWVLSSLGALVLMGMIAYVSGSVSPDMPLIAAHPLPEGMSAELEFTTSSKSMGYGLYTKYLLPLQISGFILLMAIIGVVTLSKKHPKAPSQS